LSKTTRRCTLALITSIALMALVAAPAWAAPTGVDFTVAPASPQSGVAATLTGSATPAPLTEITSWEWDLDGDIATIERTGPTVTYPFPTAGSYEVTLRVTSNELPGANQATATKTVLVVTRPPNADFDFNPTSPFALSDVLFASDASDPDREPLTYAWTFGDGGTSAVRHPIHSYALPGSYTVKLTVTDPFGATDSASKEIIVQGVPAPGNGLPVANFVFSPRTARVGDPVTFASSAFDPEGPLQEQTWDLDGDGQFDDGRGAEVVYTYTTAGMKAVRLRATDGAGQSVVREELLRVDAAPKPPPGFLRPAPNVRFNGLILARGTRIQILSVRAPRGSIVAVRCKGKGKQCPAKLRRKRVKKSTVRFKTFERFLRAGTRLEIYVRKANTIGAFTRYTIRAGKGPVRVDRCLPAGASTKPKKRCG
jgi:PKD repeat protein